MGESSHYALFQAGSKVWFAEESAGGMWTKQLVMDPGEPLAEAPLLYAGSNYASAIFRTASAAWSVRRTGADATFATIRLGTAVPTAIASYGSDQAVAVREGSGSSLRYSLSGFSDQGVVVRTFPVPITALHFAGSRLYVQLENREALALHFEPTPRVAQTLNDLRGFEIASYDSIFAGNGAVYVETNASIRGAGDPDGDQVDRNCNGYDF